MVILGMNAYHGDSSACIVIDGKLVAAAEEERFRRLKHWAGFPSRAIQSCLSAAGVEIQDVDHIAVNRDPSAHLLQKALFTAGHRPAPALIKDRLRNASRVWDIKTRLTEEIHIAPSRLRAQLHHVEHHVAHLGSSFFVSPFERAAVVSVDGFGDFVGAMWGMGEGGRIKDSQRIYFPHSLGLFYLALTQFLGFPKYGDEYKVMGMAAYGEPSYLAQMREIVHLERKGRFHLNLDFFRHHSDGVLMKWNEGTPEMDPVYSLRLEKFLGGARSPEQTVEREHQNIAASAQAMYEEAFFHILNEVYDRTRVTNLCLAGGCALNSVANGKIFDRTPFREVYIQPAAGDAGGALGAAYSVWHQVLGEQRNFMMTHAYWGPDFHEGKIKESLASKSKELNEKGCFIEPIPDQEALCRKTALKLSDGKIVGWFQGRMEWGPRALGNRSILADPRRPEMKDVLNRKIKRREPFRPFAPSILAERAGEYFETSYPDPFMIKVYPVRPEKRGLIPAVVHVDGTGRLQTVERGESPLYWKLIREFEKETGIPLLLNTSFNENEPIVCTPEEALSSFLRTGIDILVLGNYFIERRNGP